MATPFQRSIWLRDKEEWEKFVELCRKEGVPVSEKIRQWISTHVQEHWPGNPQTPLSRYLGVEVSKRICPDGERGLCPQRPALCVLRRRFACKFGVDL